MPPKITGFYWDESKGKYFKIQPDHLAPASSKYSKQAIKKEKEDNRRQQEIDRQQDWLGSWALIKRRKNTPWDRHISDRSLAGDGVPSLPNASIWAQGIAVNSARMSSTERCDCSQQKPSFGCDQSVNCLTWDKCTNRLLIALKAYLPLASHYTSLSERSNYGKFQRLSSGDDDFGAITPLNVSLSTEELTSICVLRSGKILATNSRVCKFIKEEGELSSRNDVLWACDFGRGFNPRSYYIHSSAARPESDFDVAIGTDQSMCFVNCGTDMRRPIIDHQKMTSSTLSVGWLDRNVIVGSCRDGTVNLFDVRVAGFARRLKHPSAAARVHVLSKSQLLVAGIENQMHLYDLRCTPSHLSQQSQISGRWRNWSQAYISYPTYDNQYRCDVATAVSQRLNIVAAATPQGGVKLFDLMHGDEVESPIHTTKNTQEPGSLVRSLCFLEEPIEFDGKFRGPSLFIGRKHTIDEWTWD